MIIAIDRIGHCTCGTFGGGVSFVFSSNPTKYVYLLYRNGKQLQISKTDSQVGLLYSPFIF